MSAVLFFLISCGVKETPISKTFHFAIHNAYNRYSFWPYDSFFIANLPLQFTLYSTLYRMDENLTPHPFLLEKVETKGHDVYFYIKKNLRFSDNRPILASDVVWSLIQSFNSVGSPNLMYKFIRNGEAIAQGKGEVREGLEVISPTCFVIHFVRENSLYPHYLASKMTAIMPEKSTQDRPVFSGPYMIKKIEANSEGTVVFLGRNPHYSGNPGKLENICLHYFSDHAYLQTIRDQKIDAFLNFNYPSLQAPAPYMLYKFPPLCSYYICLNPNRAPLTDKGLRQFLMNISDFSEVGRQLQWSTVSPATHILPYGLEEHFLFKPIARNLHSQQRLPHPISLQIPLFKAGIREQLAVYWKEQWAKYNVQIQVEWMENQEYWRRINANDYEVTFYSYAMDTPLAYHFFQILFTPGLELNPNYRLESAMDLLKEYENSPEPLQKLSILSRLEMLAREEAILIPIFNVVAQIGYKRNIRNLRSNYLFHIPFEEIDFEKGN